MHILKKVIPLLLYIILLYNISFCQKISLNNKFELNSIKIDGNSFFSDDFIYSSFTLKVSPGKFSQFCNKIYSGFGGEAKYFDQDQLTEDINRLIKIYHENGFSNIQIDTNIIIDQKQNFVDLNIRIKEDYRSLVDSTIYLKIDTLESNIKKLIKDNSYIPKGSGFSSEAVSRETKRIVQMLSNLGYPFAYIDNKSILISKYLSNNNYKITIPIESGNKLFFGKTDIFFEGEKKQNILDDIIYKQLEYTIGEPYSIDKKLESERNLSRLGIFEYARIEAKSGNNINQVPLGIYLKPKDRYELSPELFVNNQDYSFNLGVGLNAIIRNIGGGAQSLVGRGSLRAQSLEQGNMEFSIQWNQPYFFSNKSSLNIISLLSFDYRKEYRQNIFRNKFSINTKFKSFTFFKNVLFDWDLERAEVNILVDTQNVDTKVKELFLKLAEPQFNSIFSLTLQHDNTNDIFSPTSGNYLSISAEEAGIIPSLLISNRNKLRYSQFYKFTLFGKYYITINSDSTNILATKLKIGFADQYGKDQLLYPIPLTHRFFAGGSLSIRGWRNRELGAIENPEFGGNLIIEGNLESRIHLTKSPKKFLFLDANKIWLVFFLDFGNIWNNFNEIHLRQIAVASGFGFRYDTFFGPIRFDFGIKVYDPFEENNRWITQKKFFKEVLQRGQLHFGIAHAF